MVAVNLQNICDLLKYAKYFKLKINPWLWLKVLFLFFYFLKKIKDFIRIKTIKNNF